MPRMRAGAPRPIGGLVSKIVRKLVPNPETVPEAPPPPPMTDVVWRQVVGLAIARRTRPIELKRGVLWVQVASASWAQELAMLHDDLRLRLAQRGYVVAKLRFKVGEVGGLAREPDRVIRAQAPRAVLPEGVARALAQIPDDELRRAIEGAAATNLAWQDGLAISRRRAAPALPRAGAGSDPPDRSRPSGGAARRGTRGGS